MIRWTAKRKAEIVELLQTDPTGAMELMDRHGISADELNAWERAHAAQGLRGLRATIKLNLNEKD